MNAINAYLDEVCHEISYRKIHPTIRQELACHIQDLREAYEAAGEKPEDALAHAIQEMGPAREVGQRLHQAHRPHTEWTILALVMLLIGAGVFILSQYNLLAGTFGIHHINDVARQVVAIVIGLGLAVCLFFFDYHLLSRFALPLFLVATAITLLTLFCGPTVQGSNQWLRFPFFAIHIPSVCLLLFLSALAGLATKWLDGSHQAFFRLAGFALVAIILLAYLSLSSALFLTIVTCAIFWLALRQNHYGPNQKLHRRIFLGAVGLLLLLTILFLGASSVYHMQRLTAFLDPFADPNGAGYVGVQIHNLLQQAPLWGSVAPEELITVTGNKAASFLLPNSNTELIFTFIIAHFGWLVAAALALIIGFLLSRLICASLRLHEPLARCLAGSICVLFCAQFLCGLLMNLGLLPFTSITLPFLSYGGSAMVINLAFFGLFLGVYRRKDLVAVSTK